MPDIYAFVYCSVSIEIILDGQRNAIRKWRFRMNGHSRAFLLPEVFRLFPESEGVSGGVFEDVLGIGAFVGIRKRVHLMPNLKGSPATDNCNRDIILKKVS
ncbi:hypothetical protein HMPREF0104_04209 [Bacteroides sp. 3_1_19]|nr:hypothetical protein HMPREF0104_04209 [Bacteroides sp. 3_1_19]